MLDCRQSEINKRLRRPPMRKPCVIHAGNRAIISCLGSCPLLPPTVAAYRLVLLPSLDAYCIRPPKPRSEMDRTIETQAAIC
jgi:hypothetical protein